MYLERVHHAVHHREVEKWGKMRNVIQGQMRKGRKQVTKRSTQARPDEKRGGGKQLVRAVYLIHVIGIQSAICDELGLGAVQLRGTHPLRSLTARLLTHLRRVTVRPAPARARSTDLIEAWEVFLRPRHAQVPVLDAAVLLGQGARKPILCWRVPLGGIPPLGPLHGGLKLVDVVIPIPSGLPWLELEHWLLQAFPAELSTAGLSRANDVFTTAARVHHHAGVHQPTTVFRLDKTPTILWLHHVTPVPWLE